MLFLGLNFDLSIVARDFVFASALWDSAVKNIFFQSQVKPGFMIPACLELSYCARARKSWGWVACGLWGRSPDSIGAHHLNRPQLMRCALGQAWVVVEILDTPGSRGGTTGVLVVLVITKRLCMNINKLYVRFLSSYSHAPRLRNDLVVVLLGLEPSIWHFVQRVSVVARCVRLQSVPIPPGTRAITLSPCFEFNSSTSTPQFISFMGTLLESCTDSLLHSLVIIALKVVNVELGGHEAD
ncbi:hypothetical protein EDD16DRAFT_1527469 [Pisolithus croceorrhizus]|nr:hypothetical protein EDD16DRAFT_1527469 [Pisolithus croceorrhizus]